MEYVRECNICGGKNFEQAQDGSLKCLGCGARFASEKELQQVLQKSIEEKRKAEAKQREKEKKKELADQKAREAVEAEQNRRERAARLEREAIVLMTLHGRDGSDEKTVVIKRTEEKRVFATEGSNKVYLDNAYGLFSVDDILSVSYNYQAGKAIYTQVGHVGGITTTPSGYQASTKKTGNAKVMFASPQNKIKMEVLSVDLAHDVAKALGRASDKIEIYHNYKSSEQHTNAVKAALASHNEFMVANALMQDAGKGYPTKSGAQSIAATLNKICGRDLELPPDIYKKLEPYFESDSFEELEKAIPQLEAIRSYKDAAQRLEIMRGKYNKMAYQRAMKYSEGDLTDMEKAAQLFKSIGGYKDAFQQSQVVRDKYNERAYAQAMKYSEGNLTDMRKAAKLFESLANYKDAALRYKGTTANIEKAEKKKSKKRKKVFAIAVSAICVCIVIAILVATVIMPRVNKKAAYKKYGEALNSANVGDIVTFGMYEQDNNIPNGKEGVEWRVLAKEDDRILVISEKALAHQYYHISGGDVTWQSCSLRKWLNSTFLNDAFDTAEKTIISKASVSADKNPEYNTDPGNATIDRVFLLSITEAKKYFASNSARQCEPTEYAVANGVATYNGTGNCWWWLRTPGSDQHSAAHVDEDGPIYFPGDYVDDFYGYIGVRPAMWINLEP